MSALDNMRWHHHCNDGFEAPEIKFESLEQFFDRQRKLISSYTILIRTTLQRVQQCARNLNSFAWSEADALINGVGILPELYVVGRHLLCKLIENQVPSWSHQMSTYIADQVMSSCKTFARCHEANRLTVWSLPKNHAMYSTISSEFFAQMEQEMLTSFHQSLRILDKILMSSFVAWQHPKSMAVVTVPTAEWREMKLTFAKLGKRRTRGKQPLHLTEDIMRKIFGFVGCCPFCMHDGHYVAGWPADVYWIRF